MKLAYRLEFKQGDYIPIYGAKKICLRVGNGYENCEINGSEYVILTGHRNIEFPIIDGKSPSRLYMQQGTATDIYVEIYEFGGIPSDDYGKEL